LKTIFSAIQLFNPSGEFSLNSKAPVSEWAAIGTFFEFEVTKTNPSGSILTI
tara:strand:- start:344 stop:499 length:156 start_codon:yes stop_codon:yes gene_type:complete